MKEIAPLLEVISDLNTWLDQKEIQHIFIGGIAASLLGRPRMTRDVDLLLWLDEADWNSLVNSAGEFGIQTRIPDVLTFAEQSRVFLMRHTSTGIDIDLIIGSLPFEKDSISKSIRVNAGNSTIPVPRPEDLIVMKAVANRSKDLEDVKSILDSNSNLNTQSILKQLQSFADALDIPEILSDFEELLKQRSQ